MTKVIFSVLLASTAFFAHGGDTLIDPAAVKLFTQNKVWYQWGETRYSENGKERILNNEGTYRFQMDLYANVYAESHYEHGLHNQVYTPSFYTYFEDYTKPDPKVANALAGTRTEFKLVNGTPKVVMTTYRTVKGENGDDRDWQIKIVSTEGFEKNSGGEIYVSDYIESLYPVGRPANATIRLQTHWVSKVKVVQGSPYVEQ